jgi:hypothetical protein
MGKWGQPSETAVELFTIAGVKPSKASLIPNFGIQHLGTEQQQSLVKQKSRSINQKEGKVSFYSMLELEVTSE